MSNDIPETAEQKYQRIYKELYLLFHRERLPIHIVVDLAQDLLVSCAISACHGNQIEAGNDLREHLLPELAAKILKLQANEYPVVHLSQRDTVLDSFDVKERKPN